MAPTQVALLYFNSVVVVNVVLAAAAAQHALRALRRVNEHCELAAVFAVFAGKQWPLDELFAHLASRLSSSCSSTTTIAFSIPVFNNSLLAGVDGDDPCAQLEQIAREQLSRAPLALLARDEDDADEVYKFRMCFGTAHKRLHFHWEDARSELIDALSELGEGEHPELVDYFVVLRSATGSTHKLSLYDLFHGPVKMPSSVRVFGGSVPWSDGAAAAGAAVTANVVELPHILELKEVSSVVPTATTVRAVRSSSSVDLEPRRRELFHKKSSSDSTVPPRDDKFRGRASTPGPCTSPRLITTAPLTCL